MKMSKRVVFSDDDTHHLIDIIKSFNHIVGNKRTDAVMWKEKNTVWQNIATNYNAECSVTSRSAEQLRVKFDNIKKDARKFFSKQKQNFSGTGDGDTATKIRPSLLSIYDKVKSIIDVSYVGLDEDIGDNDFIASQEEIELLNNTTDPLDTKLKIKTEITPTMIVIPSLQNDTQQTEVLENETNFTGETNGKKRKLEECLSKQELLYEEFLQTKAFNQMKAKKEEKLYDLKIELLQLQIEEQKLKNEQLKKLHS